MSSKIDKMKNAKRCLGYTVCGKRCKKTTSDPQGRCPQHQPQNQESQPLEEPVYQYNNNLPTYDVDARIQSGVYRGIRRPTRMCSRHSVRRVSFVEPEEPIEMEHQEPIEMTEEELEQEAILCLAREAAKRGALVIMYRGE